MATKKAAAAPAAKKAPAKKAAAAPAAKKTAAAKPEAPVVAAAGPEKDEQGRLVVGTEMEFAGYADANMPEDQKLLVPGQIVVITGHKGETADDGYEVTLKETIGKPEDEQIVEHSFEDELKAAPTTAKEVKAAKKTEERNAPPVGKADAKAAKGIAKAKANPVVPPKAEEAPAEAAPAKKVAAKKAKAAEAPAPAEEPKVEKKAVVEGEVVKIQDTEAVTAALAAESNDALAAAKQLVQQSEETYFTLGGVLTHIYNEGLHKLAGFDGKRGFADYVERELNLQYRKAMYLIGIYTYFRSLGVDERRLSEIGWSKAKELVNKVTAEAFDEVVDYAAEHSREELKAYITTNTASAGDGTSGETVVKKRFVFTLFGDQAEGVERALASAGSGIEGEPANKQSLAFEMIVAEWAMSNENVEVTLEQAVEALRTRFGDEAIAEHFGIEGDLEEHLNGESQEQAA